MFQFGLQRASVILSRRCAWGVSANRFFFASLSLALSLGALSAPVSAQNSSNDPALQALLARPDGVSENLDYARARVAQGDLQGAMTALERLLLIHPNADDVRRVYAEVLLQLGDHNGAKRELALLGRRVSPDETALLRARLQEAEAKSHPFRGEVLLYSGVRTATNPRQVSGVDGDIAVTAGANLSFELDLVSSGNIWSYADVAVSADRWQNETRLNGVDASGELGLALQVGDFNFRPHVVAARGVTLDGYDFDETGYGLGLEWDASRNLSFGARARYLERDFDTGVGLFAPDLDDTVDKLDIWGKWQVNAALRLELAYQISKNDTGQMFAFNDFEQEGLSLTGVYSLPQDRWILTNLGVSHKDYTEVFGFARREDTASVALKYGAPLPFFDTETRYQIGLTYDWRDSNIGEFSEDNLGVELFLTRKFNF